MFYGQPQKFNVHHKSFQNMKEYIIKIEKMQKKKSIDPWLPISTWAFILVKMYYFVWSISYVLHPIIYQMQTTKQILIVDLRKF